MRDPLTEMSPVYPLPGAFEHRFQAVMPRQSNQVEPAPVLDRASKRLYRCVSRTVDGSDFTVYSKEAGS